VAAPGTAYDAGNGGRPAALLRAWFELTVPEQRVIIAVLALMVLGLAVRHWRPRPEREARPPAIPVRAEAAEGRPT